MNREKRLNEAGRKRQSYLNDSAGQNGDYSHAVDRYRQAPPIVDNSNTEMKARHHIPDSYDGYALTGLNSVRLNAEADRDLLPSYGRETSGCPSELYRGRMVHNSDGYHRHEKFSNREKKKKKSCRGDFDRTISPSSVVPLRAEDGAAGFVVGQMRSIDNSSRQDHIGMQHSPSNTSRNELFYSDDHLLPAASIAATEKVFSLTCGIFT